MVQPQSDAHNVTYHMLFPALVGHELPAILAATIAHHVCFAFLAA